MRGFFAIAQQNSEQQKPKQVRELAPLARWAAAPPLLRGHRPLSPLLLSMGAPWGRAAAWLRVPLALPTPRTPHGRHCDGFQRAPFVLVLARSV